MKTKQNKGPARLHRQTQLKETRKPLHPVDDSPVKTSKKTHTWERRPTYTDGQIEAAKGLLREVNPSEWGGPRRYVEASYVGRTIPLFGNIQRTAVERPYLLEQVWEVRRHAGPFEEFVSSLKQASINPNIKKLFHGTKPQNVVGIITKGLRPGQGRSLMFGTGIYFGGFPKAFAYGMYDNAAYVFQAEVALGKSLLKTTPNASLNGESVWSDNYYSVEGRRNLTASYAGTLNMDEYVVYGWNQVNLRYLAMFVKR